MKRMIAVGLLTSMLIAGFSVCGGRQEPEPASAHETEAGAVDEKFFTRDTAIAEVIDDPVFDTYGRLIFPVDSSYMSGNTLGELRLAWYSGIDADKTVEIVNYMKEHAGMGETIFYDIYTEEEQAADPDKRDTGLFFFKGNPGEKFAICSAGGGFDILSHIMETYFSEPDGDNVSDDIAEALMRGVIRDLRAAIRNPRDYTARSNLMWESTMAENRIIKLGKRMDFEGHQIEHQLGAYTNCNHGAGLAVLQPVYYRHIYHDGLEKFKKFAVNVWGISPEGKTEEELACAGVEALENFVKELGLPTTLREIGVTDEEMLKRIADSCNLNPGGYRKMTPEEIFKIFQECL